MTGLTKDAEYTLAMKNSAGADVLTENAISYTKPANSFTAAGDKALYYVSLNEAADDGSGQVVKEALADGGAFTITVTNTKDESNTDDYKLNLYKDEGGKWQEGTKGEEPTPPDPEQPTLTVAPSTADDLLGKSAADLQGDVKADGLKVSGISKYVTGYTGFNGAVEEEQEGNYIALVLTSSDGKHVWVLSSDSTKWTKVDESDNTMVLLLNKYTDKLITVAISDETPAADAETLTLDLTGVTLVPAPAVVDKLTVEGIGFEAVPADAQSAMAELGSAVLISDIDVDTMFVRFNGMDAEKTYKVVFTNADNETVYDSLQTDGNQNSVITGRTAVTVYFTFNKDGGSHTLKDIASGTYTATLYEKTGDTWTALTEFDGDNTISLNSLTIKKTAAEAGTKTFYKTGTVVVAPTAAAAEVTVPDHYKFTGWTDGTDTYQAGDNVTVSKDITLTAGTELGAITELTAAAPKATLVAEVKSGAIVISGLVTEGTDTVTVTYVLDTCPAEETHTATVTLVAGQEDGFTTDSKVTIFGTEYTVDVSGIIVSAQVVNAGSEVEVSDSVAQEHQETVAAAAQSTTIAHEEMVALVADNAKEVSAAAAAVTSEQKTAAAEALNALAGVTGATSENVATVVQPIMQVKAEAYDPDAKELKMDISAGYRLVAVKQEVLEGEGAVQTEGDGANAVVIPNSTKTMTVSTPVTVSVELPAAIAGTNATIAVLHEKNGNHYHQADIVRSGVDPDYVYTATFTSDDGLSPFTFKAATLVAKIGDTYYETLQDAVNAVANGGIITLINNIPADHVATVSGSTSKTFTIAVSGKAFVAGNTSPAAVDNEDGTYTVTYTYSGGGSGGSSGGSSNKPTTPTKPTNPTQFVDVPAGAYYTDAVKWAVEKGITTGMTDTTFAPNGDCTRAQMVTFLWRAAGSPKAEGENPFTDVAAGAYYYDAVLWAVSKGITNGTSAATFSPDATVSRAQTVTFLHRYAGAPEASGNSFTDVTAGSYYEGAVDWAVAEGVTQGTSDTTFSPDADCVRAQIVTFLYRYMVK